ncbi:unnamed protein product [Knipowitschia caucasica]
MRKQYNRRRRDNFELRTTFEVTQTTI